MKTDQERLREAAMLTAIEAAKHLGAKTAKEAAEMTQGRLLTRAEWRKRRPTWERAWKQMEAGD